VDIFPQSRLAVNEPASISASQFAVPGLLRFIERAI